MKKTVKKFPLIITILIFGLLTAGCGASKPEVSENSAISGGNDIQPAASGDESVETSAIKAVQFDPMDLGDDGIFIPRKPSTKNDIYNTTADAPAEEIFEEQETQGFRVQIFSSSTNQSARQIEKTASGQFSEGVYLTYDPPTYKVRVGNCVSKEEADDIRQKALSLGYRDAWVVRDKIVVKVKVN